MTPEIEEIKCRRCGTLLKDCSTKRWLDPLCTVDGATWDEHVIGLSNVAALHRKHLEDDIREMEGMLRDSDRSMTEYNIGYNAGSNQALDTLIERKKQLLAPIKIDKQ